jgi:hypothetical protein
VVLGSRRVILRQFWRRLWGWTLPGAAVCVAGIACIPVTPPALFSDSARPNEVIATGDFDGSLAMHRQSIEDRFLLAAPAIGMAAGLLAFALAHRRTRREWAVPAQVTVRTAWLRVMDWLAMLAPPAIPLATLKPNNSRFLRPGGRPNAIRLLAPRAVMELVDRAWTATTSSIVRLA